MTNNELRKYYADLLIIQYRGKPKARGMIEAIVDQVIMNQLPEKLENAFDLETAVGKQLDILGSRLGVTRNVFLRNGDPITLNDDDFRTYVKLQAARMTLRSSLYDIQTLLIDFFGDEIQVYDNQDMTIDYYIFGQSQTLVDVAIKQDMLPRPMGVRIREIYNLPTNRIYGFQDYNNQDFPVIGFNDYENFDDDTVWIDYDMVEIL